MSNEPDHTPADDQSPKERGPLSKVVDVLVGDTDTDARPRPDHGPRGWEKPLEEQQGEPENEPHSSA